MNREHWSPPRPYYHTHPIHTHYDLYPGDLLNRSDDGTWEKCAPGLAISGFVLSARQELDLDRVVAEWNGLDYTIVGGDRMNRERAAAARDDGPPEGLWGGAI